MLTADLVRRVYGVDAEVMTHPRTGRPVIAFGDAGPAALADRPLAAVEGAR